LTHPIRWNAIAVLTGAIAVLAAPAAWASVASELAFHRGVVAFGDERWDEAQAEFDTVVAEDPEDTAALQYLGLIAQEQGDYDRAVEFYDRALAIDPTDPDVKVDRASALLELGKPEEAKQSLDEVLAERPDDPRANLFAGIAEYRTGEYEAAIDRLDRAKKLDPSLETHATYYAGLSAAFLGNFEAASGAFAAVEDQSPLSPLSTSARSLRKQMRPDDDIADQPWQASISAGIEWDSNPTFAGKANPNRPPGGPNFGDQEDDYRGVFRLRGQYDVVDQDPYKLTAGYDGYLSKHAHADRVDLQTHAAWLSGTANFDPFRFGLRYDYAFTFVDLDKKFRSLNRITPSATYRQQDWGIAQVYFQWQNEQFLQNVPNIFDRDGNRYSVGFNQFFFVGDPISYLRLGTVGEFLRSDANDFSFNGFEVSGGYSILLPFEIEWTTLYRFLYRNYLSTNALPADFATGRMDERLDLIHKISLEFVRNITEHLEASVAGSLTWQNTNIDVYEHNRFVVGGYLTYHF